MATVYIETTVVSYLTSRPSRDLIVAGHQQLTREWWDIREQYQLVTSEFVLNEAARGDRTFAARRFELLRNLTLLQTTAEVSALADKLIHEGPIPTRAQLDAAHIAIAAVHEVDFLLTWNCRHIANPRMLRGLNHICSSAGYDLPVICTPGQLLAEVEDAGQ
jgi:hypothetical protein